MSINSKYINQRGFTIVELLIATAVFSVVLLLCGTAIVHVGRMYYKGIITNRTQDTSRRVLEDVTQAIQFGNSAASAEEFRHTSSQNYTNASGQAITVQSLCLGQTRYSYVTDRAVGTASNQVLRVLWRDTVTTTEAVTCTPANIVGAATPTGGSNGVGLLGSNMRLPVFRAESVGGGWNIQIRVSYGEATDFENNGADIPGEGTYAFCRGVVAGGQFCAVSNLNTSVMKRL